MKGKAFIRRDENRMWQYEVFRDTELFATGDALSWPVAVDNVHYCLDVISGAEAIRWTEESGCDAYLEKLEGEMGAI